MKIVSVKAIGHRRTFDIEVRGQHNFVANGVVVHNCTSTGAQQFFVRAKPRSIIDIAALTSIYRPGPLAADVDKLWLKHRDEPFDWGHPLINETLKETRGLLVFQESVMQLANKVGGFPMEKCDEVRRAIMKRSISGGEAAKQKAQELEDTFVQGAVSKGVPEHIAKKAYQTILFMSGYGFNACLYGNQLISVCTDKGLQCKKIKDVKENDTLVSRDEVTKSSIQVRVKRLHRSGTKKLVRVRLKTGEEVTCTLDHKFRVRETGQMLPLHEILQRDLTIVVDSSTSAGGA